MINEEMPKKVIRYRFAPSPTGFLHIGGARTAVFNYLLARNQGGRFVIRIEDTDRQRSDEKYEADILDALKWLGIEWDEEILRQSSRISFYQEIVDELLERGAAYRDFMDPEEAVKMKQAAIDRGEGQAFRSPDRGMSPQQSDDRMMAGEPYAIRFKVPDEPVVFTDGVHGKVVVNPETIEDFIIQRRDGAPTYQMAVVVDDWDMGITNVVRGNDHITNTPKQILIYKALGWDVPEFAHVPLILGPDKKRLSKRHGATALTEYRDKGYLPEALFSFLAMMGWSPGDDRELLTPDELIEAFTIKGINDASAVFDEKKLEWVNGEFLSRTPDEVLFDMLKMPFAQNVARGEFPKGSATMLPVAIAQLKGRARFPMDILERGDFYFKDPETLDPKAARKRLKDENTPAWLDELANRFEALEDWTEEALDETLRVYSEELEVGAGKLIHPTRLAVSGVGGGPSLFEMLHALGKETVMRRMRWLANLLREKGTPPQL